MLLASCGGSKPSNSLGFFPDMVPPAAKKVVSQIPQDLAVEVTIDPSAIPSPIDYPIYGLCKTSIDEVRKVGTRVEAYSDADKVQTICSQLQGQWMFDWILVQADKDDASVYIPCPAILSQTTSHKGIFYVYKTFISTLSDGADRIPIFIETGSPYPPTNLDPAHQYHGDPTSSDVDLEGQRNAPDQRSPKA